MDLEILQHYWWILLCILGGLLVFLLFVQGGQSLLYTIGKNKEERDLLVNTLGHKWEFTFTTLVVFGGAFFASFPLFYSTSFGGAYVVWMLILFCFVIQAVSYEYRSKRRNFLGTRTYETFLMINGFAAPFLLGAAVATFFTGSPSLLPELSVPLFPAHPASPVTRAAASSIAVIRFNFISNAFLSLSFSQQVPADRRTELQAMRSAGCRKMSSLYHKS